MMLYVFIMLLLLWNMHENSYQCSEECVDCRSDNRCHGCNDGYYVHSQRCRKCSDGCSSCKQSHINCSACKPGHWGDWCQYSCIPCVDCSDCYCTSYCKDAAPSRCFNSPCPYKCSFRFTGRRKNHSASSTPKTDCTTLSASKQTRQPSPITTLPKTATRTTKINTSFRSTQKTATQDRKAQRTTQQIWTPSKPNYTTITTKRTKTSHLMTQRKATAFMEHDTTTKQSNGTEYFEQPGAKVRANRNGTTGPTKTQTDVLDHTVVYVVINVVGVLIMTVAAVTVVVVCIKRRISRQDQVTCIHDANNKAVSQQLADNAGGNSNVSHHGNAIGNIATTNVAEIDTGYVDMNTIDNVATMNVARRDTGFVDMTATAYENVVDKTDMNASDTVNAYEALTQYTNVREAENKYTSLSGNENVYYSVLD